MIVKPHQTPIQQASHAWVPYLEFLTQGCWMGVEGAKIEISCNYQINGVGEWVLPIKTNQLRSVRNFLHQLISVGLIDFGVY